MIESSIVTTNGNASRCPVEWECMRDEPMIHYNRRMNGRGRPRALLDQEAGEDVGVRSLNPLLQFSDISSADVCNICHEIRDVALGI